jgi:hypothetical protein
VTLAHSISLWDADDRRAWIYFFSSAPTTAEREEILQGRGGTWPEKKTLFVELRMVFRPASVNAELATLAHYHVELCDFQDDPVPNHRYGDLIGSGPLVDWTKQKEVIEVSGALKRGGRLKGRFKGDREATIENGRTKLEWSLTFDVKLE